MITAEAITKLAFLSTSQLEFAVRKNYPKDSFISSKFLGITNGGQFCYQAGYNDEELNGPAFVKVFVELGLDGQPVGQY